MSWQCTYTRTLSGTCDQQREMNKEHCYYHSKVVAGFIEDVDEKAVLRDMPTISL